MRMSELAFGRTRNRSLLGTLNDFAFMAQIGGRSTGGTRVAGGADAVPLADPDPSAGGREPDRADASRIWASIGAVTATAWRRSGVRLFGIAWARQDYPPALRGLDPPGALPTGGNCRSARGSRRSNGFCAFTWRTSTGLREG
jgi:hypothetical protein